jgi:hypothetical protein
MAKNTNRGGNLSYEGKHDGCSFAALCCHVSKTCLMYFFFLFILAAASCGPYAVRFLWSFVQVQPCIGSLIYCPDPQSPDWPPKQ